MVHTIHVVPKLYLARLATVLVLVLVHIPSLLTDFKISNFVTFSYSGSMRNYKNTEGFFTSYKIFFSALKKKVNCNFFHQCTQLKLVFVPVSARNLGKSYRGIFEKTPYMYRFPLFPQYGGTSEKLRVRKNVVVTNYLSGGLGQHCTQLQFGMLFIIVQNLEIF